MLLPTTARSGGGGGEASCVVEPVRVFSPACFDLARTVLVMIRSHPPTHFPALGLNAT